MEILRDRLNANPVVAMLGARQTGKTTLARLITETYDAPIHYFDLERASDRAALETPETTLGGLAGLIVIDEIQRLPALFEVMRPLVDRDRPPARFLVLGSASPVLVRGVSESLAGRVALVDIPGFALSEIGVDHLRRLWLRGGFPRSYLAPDDTTAGQWREDFITTFLEREMPQLGIRIPAETMRRFWMMLAHYHGQTWNASEVGRSLQVTEKTTRHYLDILTGAFLTRVLPSWHENLGKRQVKSPKVYIRDSGLLHQLMGVETWAALTRTPKYGASWEGFALEQILMRLPARSCFYWRTQRGAELDLLSMAGGRRIGFEFKCADAPRLTRSMKIAMDDLRLDWLHVVYPGDRAYQLADRIAAVPLVQWCAGD